MICSVKIIKKHEQKTTLWSGGSTTQLAIYPEDSEYSQRNFKWRISSAKVEVEESTFTQLPGIWRLIMVLEGELQLEHIGHHSSNLKEFEQDSFSGEWTTKCIGQAVDFNLMFSEGCSGGLEGIYLDGDKHVIHINAAEVNNKLTKALYCLCDELDVEFDDGQHFPLKQNDLLIADITNSNSVDEEKISLYTAGSGKAILCTIHNYRI